MNKTKLEREFNVYHKRKDYLYSMFVCPSVPTSTRDILELTFSSSWNVITYFLKIHSINKLFYGGQ